MEGSESEWFRHLAVSLWLRVPDTVAAFTLADAWACRVEDEVLDDVVRQTPASVWEPGPNFEGSGLEPMPLPHVTRRLQTMSARGSVRGRDLRRGRHIAEAAARAKNPVGGFVNWSLDEGRSVILRYSVWDVPSDPDEPTDGHELLLSCWIMNLAQRQRDQVARIAQDIAQSADLTYGQVGSDKDTWPALLQAHPAGLGRYQAWQMQRLRGYDWVTMIPPHLAAQIDRAHLDYGRDHLHRVEVWANGGLSLQATPTPETYTMDAVRHVFRTVAQILPDGAPAKPVKRSFAEPEQPARMLVYEDPADYR